MSGLLPHQLVAANGGAMQGLTPEQVAADPYMQQSNPLMDLLIQFFQSTEGVQPFGRQGGSQPTPTPSSSVSERMRAVSGPIQANEPKRIASERDRILRELDNY